jgi:hypothetical protein
MHTIEEFDAFLSNTLDNDCRLLCSMHDPPTPGEVQAIVAAVDMPLPEEYLAFQRHFGAAYVEVKEDIWPRPRPYAVGPYWSFLYACIVFGIGPEVPELLDIRVAAETVRNIFGPSLPFPLTPLFRWMGSADYTCCDSQGRLFQLSHEAPESPEPLSGSFFDFLGASLQTLVKNKTRLRTEAAHLFETEDDRRAKRRAAAEKDAALTSRRCPQCGAPLPSYRKVCKVCGSPAS